mgnify:CR=1 FL=1
MSPFYYSNLGYGSEFKYRYVLDRLSRGQWFVSALAGDRDTELVRREPERDKVRVRLGL